MGHIAHLRKQFKSINTYDYIITLIKRRKNPYLLYENSMVLHLNKLESPSFKDALCQVWLKLAQRLWIKIIKFCQCIFAISKLSPLGKGRAFHLNKLESPSPKDALCQVWLKSTQWFLRRIFF